MVTTRPPKTIVKPTALGPVANTDTKLLIYGLFQKGRVLAQDGIKGAFNVYSRSAEGRTYTLLLPTVDDRLKEKALFEEDGIYYLQGPIFERPLQVIPPNLRPAFVGKLNELVEDDGVADFLERHPDYDGEFGIQIDGLISPFSDYVLDDFMRAKNLDFGELLPYLKVKRMIYDARTKTGIGSYTPRDEKSQEAGSLVGNIDYSLLPRFGSESHPLVHDYKGELCAGANGFVEIHEILKLSDRFLYELLFATQDRFFKPEGQPPIPFNGAIIGHTNFHEYNMFMANETFEALRSRTTFIEMPLSVNFKDEERIYAFTYSNAHDVHAPDAPGECCFDRGRLGHHPFGETSLLTQSSQAGEIEIGHERVRIRGVFENSRSAVARMSFSAFKATARAADRVRLIFPRAVGRPFTTGNNGRLRCPRTGTGLTFCLSRCVRMNSPLPRDENRNCLPTGLKTSPSTKGLT